MTDSPNALREWRRSRGLRLQGLRDLFFQSNRRAPSIATLSRVERGELVTEDLLRDLVAITGIPARELRPDLAKLFDKVGP